MIKDRPSQKDKQTIADFHNEYLNYLKLRAYISGTAVNLNDPGEKELFFGSLKRGEDLLSATYDERNSNDPVKQSMYTQGNLVATLEAAYKRLTPRASPQLTSPIPKLRYSSTSSRSSNSSKSPPKAKVQRVNAVTFDETDPFRVDIPEGLEHLTGLRDCYVNAIATNGSGFDTSRPCLACGKAGHTFDDCALLKNTEFLRRHYTGFQSFAKRHSLDSAKTLDNPATTHAGVNKLHLEHHNYSHADPLTTDEPPVTEDFHPGRE